MVPLESARSGQYNAVSEFIEAFQGARLAGGQAFANHRWHDCSRDWIDRLYSIEPILKVDASATAVPQRVHASSKSCV
jgi:hypothetical protein